MTARCGGLNDAAHPAVLRLIAQVARYGREAGMPVSLCGDMASDPAHLAGADRSRAARRSRWRRRGWRAVKAALAEL